MHDYEGRLLTWRFCKYPVKLPLCKPTMQMQGLILLLAKRALYTLLQLRYLPPKRVSKGWHVLSCLTIQQQGTPGVQNTLCHCKAGCAGAGLGCSPARAM